MPSQVLTSVENNFTKGLITEFTGMNFPENAATDCDNVEFDIIGDVHRRLGIAYEANSSITAITTTSVSFNSYKWDNAGGDGSSQLVVQQVGSTLHFYDADAATTAVPLSNNKLASTVDMTDFVVAGETFDSSVCCEFTDGNGYLFVFHPSCDPVYCTYDGDVTGALITIQIRDFAGITEAGVADDTRPSTLTDSHKYNLQNQGWTAGNPWEATSTSTNSYATGAKTFIIQSGLTITPGQSIQLFGSVTIESPPYHRTEAYLTGTVTSYSGTTLIVSVTSGYVTGGTSTFSTWGIIPVTIGYINTWNTDVGNYPSNADQWWRFKNTSNVFAPSTTQANVSIGATAAPKGHYILNAFSQLRDVASSINGLTAITTTARPTNGCWFQGRIWYTGVKASQAASGTADFTTWTENIYFSQIVNRPIDFGKCYQANDPTSEELFDILPTDGGVIVIQGSGPIYRLFPIQNGLLVFAANGVWFITGSQGIGFAANDYTITKISNIQSISTSSYVNVMGLPYFWNEEGIYQVSPSQSGSLSVNAITVGTILQFYNEIPLESKKNARGAYHPIDYVIQWIYKNSNSTDTTDKFTFDRILNFNVYNKAFFPYTLGTETASVKSIVYVSGPGGTGTPSPVIKFFAGTSTDTAFADIHTTDYLDWGSEDYTSYFITGYKLHGQAQRRFQIPYLYMYSRNDGAEQQYKIQSRWDYTTSGSSGRWSSQQVTYIDSVYQSTVFKRHRLRGHGLVLQIKVTSMTGQPFDIIGWSVFETQNMSV